VPRSAGTSVENNFTNGLITEATGLNFPENAVIDTNNCYYDERSVVTRRLGFDLEAGYTLESFNPNNNTISTFYWRSAAGNGNYNFLVRQIGTTLRFYRVSASTSLSSTLHPYSLNVETFKSPGSTGVGDVECRFAAGYGYLFVVHPLLDPFYVEYIPSTNTFVARNVNLQVRDFDGMEYLYPVPGLPSGVLYPRIEDRVTTLNIDHLYNLMNQGWDQEYIQTMFQQRGFYPSNADVQWLWRNAEGVIKFYVEESGSFNGNSFKTRYYQDRVEKGNTPAPKGHFIMNPFYQDRSAASGIPSLPVVSAGVQRPSTVEFYAGRAWYAGVATQGFNNKIYFTQIIQSKDEIGKCHQVNDPTSEYQFDLLPTDGGVIVIPSVGEIHRLFAMESALVVFASNGVWLISGSQGVGFLANDYSVRKLTTFSTISPNSFVDAGGIPIWWNYDGIYTLAIDSAMGSAQIKNLSEQKIKSWFKSIPNASKRYAKGAFDSLEGIVKWIYRTTEISDSDITGRYEYDGILNLNVVSGSFYPYTVSSDRVKILSITSIQGLGTTDEEENVTANDGTVVQATTLASVTAQQRETREYSSVVKYLVKVQLPNNTWRLSFAEERRTEYFDWIEVNSVYGTASISYLEDYESYFISGYRLRGEAIKTFQTHYLQILTEKQPTETAYYFQTLWDFSTGSSVNKWSSQQKVVIPPEEKKYQHRRLRVRGSGLACQFKISAESGKPFAIIGWVSLDSANSTP
jgi:hypothetical protein